MRRFSVILVLAAYLTSFSEFHQFLKIPVLVQHFIEHRQEDPSISFVKFLSIHYNGKFTRDDDYQRDSQLPFRTMECMVYSIPIVEWQHFDLNMDPQHIIVEKDYNIANEQQVSTVDPADIFQPPRIA